MEKLIEFFQQNPYEYQLFKDFKRRNRDLWLEPMSAKLKYYKKDLEASEIIENIIKTEDNTLNSIWYIKNYFEIPRKEAIRLYNEFK